MRVGALSAFFCSGAALVCGGLAVREASISAPNIEKMTAQSLPEGKPGRWYAHVHDRAATAGRLDLALVAARSEVARAPSAGGYQRLAFAETAIAGSPTREALSALLESYQLAAYVPPADTVWRVEFAARFWPAMPDIIQDKTLTQMDVMTAIGESWETRLRWCKEFSPGALKQAACASLE